MNKFAILSVHFGPTLTNDFRLIFVCEAATLSLLQKDNKYPHLLSWKAKYNSTFFDSPFLVTFSVYTGLILYKSTLNKVFHCIGLRLY